MFKQALGDADLSTLAVIGLLLFVAVFVGVIAWTLSRSRRQVDAWSSLPLADGKDPVEPRGTNPDHQHRDDHRGGGSASDGSASGDGCGDCATCSCEPTPLTITTFQATDAARL